MFLRRHVGKHTRDAPSCASENEVGRASIERLACSMQSLGCICFRCKIACIRLQALLRILAVFLPANGWGPERTLSGSAHVAASERSDPDTRAHLELFERIFQFRFASRDDRDVCTLVCELTSESESETFRSASDVAVLCGRGPQFETAYGLTRADDLTLPLGSKWFLLNQVMTMKLEIKATNTATMTGVDN